MHQSANKEQPIFKLLQFSKFGLIGALTTIFGITCNYILLEQMSLPLYPVYICVFLVGVLISYLLNSKFTFHKKPNLQDATGFYASYLVGLAVGLLLLFLFDKMLDFSPFILTLLIIIPRFILTFGLVKMLSFK